MKELFNIHNKDKKPIYLLTILFVFVNLFWAFYSDNTWDDDCPGRFQNTLHAIKDPSQFVSLWNRPLFILIFVLPVQLGAWTIPVIQTFFSIIAGISLYQVAKYLKLRFAYLAFPLLAMQPFVFGVSKYAMTEPLAITLICLSLFFQINEKWNAFALCGALLPLARMELAVLFPFYITALINAKKYIQILILGIPGILWALVGGIIHGDINWIIGETIGKESKENRYGHQEWHTYLSRYAYVVGPVLMFYSILGAFKSLKSRFSTTYILTPFLLGFFVYTLFSWKLNMGNAAGFLRNIIPISPFLAIICLMGINTWFSYAHRSSFNIKELAKSKLSKNWIGKAKLFNRKIGNGKFYGFIVLLISYGIIYIFYPYKLELHHKIDVKTKDDNLIIASTVLFLLSASFFLLKRKFLNRIAPIGVLIVLFGYTLKVEHPMANSSDQREVVSEFANQYNQTYLKERITHVNHPWFYWSAGIDKFDPQMNVMKKDSLKNAKIGAIAIFETHYSHRLNGDVNQTFLSQDKNWVELTRKLTPKRDFAISAYEKVNGIEEYEKAHFKFIKETDSLDPTSFFCLGNTYLTKFKDFEKAYNAFAKSVNIDSTYTEGFLGLGMTMANKGNFKSAIEFYNKGLDGFKNHPNLMMQKGIAHLNLKEFNAAIKMFKKVSEINIKDHNSWFYLGLCYQNLNKAIEAISAYEQCLNRNPKFAQAWQNVAIIQYHKKDINSACQNINKAAQLGSAAAKNMAKQICSQVKK